MLHKLTPKLGDPLLAPQYKMVFKFSFKFIYTVLCHSFTFNDLSPMVRIGMSVRFFGTCTLA